MDEARAVLDDRWEDESFPTATALGLALLCYQAVRTATEAGLLKIIWWTRQMPRTQWIWFIAPVSRLFSFCLLLLEVEAEPRFRRIRSPDASCARMLFSKEDAKARHLQLLDLLRHLVSDAWWSCCWIFQEEFYTDYEMILLILYLGSAIRKGSFVTLDAWSFGRRNRYRRH